MSGILGIWNSQKPTPWQRMLDDLTVFGQDGRGDWHDTSVGLSLGRAQFFNTPESSHEVPVIEYEGCVLVWDGRIDEREPLLAGRSNITDAQLIIESYRRWGIECLRHLIGEFVFILWDASNDLLFVGCDVVGARTIAYHWNGQTLLLSSRVLTLLLHPQVSKELDQLYLAHTICNFWTHPPESTAFDSIKRLLPGHALILKSGELQKRKVAELHIAERYQLPKSLEDYYEKFWYILNQSTKDRLRSYRSPCVMLSGGLDSTTVTVSLLNQLPSVDAFSAVTKVHPEFDERKPIQSFLQRYPQVNWHEVNCDDAWAFSEPWERLPITDDPYINPTSSMNFRLMEQMQKSGCGLYFDGEWGDELFYTTLLDLAKTGTWQPVWDSLKNQKPWYSSLWRELFVPNLPKYLQNKWFARCRRKYGSLPTWLTPSYRNTPEIKTAIQQYFESTLPASPGQIVALLTQSGGYVGLRQVARLFSYVHQMEYTSPLQDKRLMEFTINLHPSLQNDSEHYKIFLRKVNKNYLPADVLWRPKENYYDPLKYNGLGKSEYALKMMDKLQKYPILANRIDTNCLKNKLHFFRQEFNQNYSHWQSFHNDLANKLYKTLVLIDWYERIQAY